MFTRFGTIHERDVTDGRTDGQTSYDGIRRATHSVARQKAKRYEADNLF